MARLIFERVSFLMLLTSMCGSCMSDMAPSLMLDLSWRILHRRVRGCRAHPVDAFAHTPKRQSLRQALAVLER